MKAQAKLAKAPLRRNPGPASAMVRQAPASNAQRRIGRAETVPHGGLPSQGDLRTIRREPDDDADFMLHARGGAKERGIGLLYVKNWSKIDSAGAGPDPENCRGDGR